MINLKTYLKILGFWVIFIIAYTLVGAETIPVTLSNRSSYTVKEMESLAIEKSPSVESARLKITTTLARYFELSSSRKKGIPPNNPFYSNDSGNTEKTMDLRSWFNNKVQQDMVTLQKVNPTHAKEWQEEILGLNRELQETERKALLEFREDYLVCLQEKMETDNYLKRIPIHQELLNMMKNRYEQHEVLLDDVLQAERLVSEDKVMAEYHQLCLNQRVSFIAESFGIDTGAITLNTGMIGSTIEIAALKSIYDFLNQNRGHSYQRDVLRGYQDYQYQNVRLKIVEKKLALINDELRMEQLRIDNPIRGVKTDYANSLRLNATKLSSELERDITLIDRLKSIDKLTCMAGAYYPEELLPKTTVTIAVDSSNMMMPYYRAMWVWEPDKLIHQDKDNNPDNFIAFCLDHRIQQVFVSLNRELLNSLSGKGPLSEWIQKLHKNNIMVSALKGDSAYLTPEGRQLLMQDIQQIIDYNAKVDSSAGFDAIHLNMEAPAQDAHEKDNLALLENLRDTYSIIKNRIRGSVSTLKLEVDIPVFDSKMNTRVLEEIIQTVDLVTIMAYKRTTAARIIEDIRGELQVAEKYKKPVFIGMNTRDFSNAAQLENLIREAGRGLDSYNSFTGFSLQDYEDYMGLLRR